MKKVLSVLVCLGLLGVSACSITPATEPSEADMTEIEAAVSTIVTTAEPSEETTEETTETTETTYPIIFDDVHSVVTFTVPYDVAGDITQAELDDQCEKNEEFLAATLNEDRSVTYTMTQDAYQEYYDTLYAKLAKVFENYVDSSSDMLSVTYNEDFTEFVVEYRKTEVTSFDKIICYMMFAVSEMFGQRVGKMPEDITVTVVYYYSVHEEVIFELDYARYLEFLEYSSEIN